MSLSGDCNRRLQFLFSITNHNAIFSVFGIRPHEDNANMIYFWSDTHFYHEGIIRHCNRPFSSVEEMNESMIERWNAVVKERDTIYHLGDFGFRGGLDGKGLEIIFGRLNGNKHLVIGNHDEQNPQVLKLKWGSVSLLKKVKDSGMRAVACHYPFETWAGVLRGYFHVHGHSHGTLKRKLPRRFDVGVDVYPEPVSFDFLNDLANTEQFLATDHHGDI